MAEVKSVSVKISTTGVEDAKLKIGEVAVKADELGKKHPEITPEINKTKALLEARLLRDGIKRELSGSLNSSGGGLFSGILGGANGVGTTSLPVVGNVYGLAAAIGGIAALLPELVGVASGLAAAGAGVTAFGALALPTFKNIENAYTGIQAAQKKYNDAVALEKDDPTKAHAKDAALALKQLKDAEDKMPASTKQAVGGIESLIGEYKKMAAAFAPDAMKVFNAGLKIANTLLPDLKPFATIAGNALDGLLGKADKFFKSADFKKWLGSFEKLVGPSITAIGTGFGKVAGSIGKLLTSLSPKDVVHAINIAFGAISGTIDVVTASVKFLAKAWDWASQVAIPAASSAVLKTFAFILGGVQFFEDAVLGAFKKIIDGAAKLAGWVPGFGSGLKTAAKSFDNFYNSVHSNLSTAQKNLRQWAQDMQNAPKKFRLEGDISDLTNKLKIAKKELSDPKLTATQKGLLRLDISNLIAQRAKALALLASLNGQTATTYINTAYNTIGRPTGMPRAHAAGGPASGLSLVGEQGPELVTLPQGSYVHNARQTRGMLGGNQYTININTLVASRDTGRQVVEAIRQFEKGSGKSWRAA